MCIMNEVMQLPRNENYSKTSLQGKRLQGTLLRASSYCLCARPFENFLFSHWHCFLAGNKMAEEEEYR